MGSTSLSSAEEEHGGASSRASGLFASGRIVRARISSSGRRCYPQLSRRRATGPSWPSYATFIDLKAAPDTVPHQALFARLRAMGTGTGSQAAQPSHHAPASSSPLHCHARSASIPRHIAPRVPVVVFSPCSVAARSVCGDCQCAPVVLGLPVSDVCRAASPAPHCGALRISIIERRRQ